jgi:lycopene beta-cyclase
MASEVHVLGDGCAAMMLAAQANEMESHALSIVRPDGAPEPKDHMLGFWATPGLESAANTARFSWSKWSVVSEDANAELVSEDHPYHVMHKTAFLDRCRTLAVAHGVRFIDEETHAASQPQSVFDTRPPRAPENAMLQHFVGLEVEVDQPVFNPSTAVLMDFRVDQSQGMHFMYVLPFSATTALVESTMFSPQTMPRDFYVEAIEAYLFTHHNAAIKTVLREEQGVIPMGTLALHDPALPGLGANGGAIRPASGYTFAFIHHQIQNALERVKNGRELKFERPHKRVDVWMDGVLLTVLRHWPHYAPNLFTRMAQSLSGEEFIRFMTGNASWRLRFKVMRAMPKVPFIRGVSKWMFSRPRRVVQ